MGAGRCGNIVQPAKQINNNIYYKIFEFLLGPYNVLIIVSMLLYLMAAVL